MLGKISPVTIILEHIRTLESNKTGKVSFGDLVLFYLLPLFSAIGLALYYEPSDSLSNILITSFSVFAALLFNLMILALDAIRKERELTTPRDRLLLLMKHTYSNIAYAVLVCLVTISLLLIPYFCKEQLVSWFQKSIWILAYTLLINFILTMAMILKRMQIIFTKVIE